MASSVSSSAPATLILLRHGESQWNALNLFTGWVDVDLTDRGREEGRRAGADLLAADLLPDVLHTFRRGHRMQIQVQSSWFPLVDRNPQTFVPNIARAQAADFRKALHQVHRTPKAPSAVTVRVLK